MGSEDDGNLFERNPIKTLLAIAMIVALSIEGASFLLLSLKGKTGPDTYWYNRTLSGYRVFKNTPNFTYGTIRENPDDPAAVTDEYGFVSDAPVSLVKPEGTIRIFLMGGSALFGAGQASAYSAIHEYSHGGTIYSYPRSIAGYLKKDLERSHPGVHFEVINAAAFQHTLHQSLLFYLDTVSRFSPDFVINMDGYNDVPGIYTGTPYTYLEHEVQNYSILLNQFESNRWLKDNVYAFRAFSTFRRRFLLAPQIGAGNSDNKASSLAIGADMPGAFRERAAGFTENAQRLVNIFEHYMAVLRNDSVPLIFTLQPMLDRKAGNKPLSEIESKMAAAFGLWHGSHSQTEKENGALILRYFFDDYLTGEFARQAVARDVHYIDIGQRLKEVPAEVEIYTDYCHLTPEGNRRVAALFEEGLIAKGLTEKISSIQTTALRQAAAPTPTP
jgi:hypothetical protein